MKARYNLLLFLAVLGPGVAAQTSIAQVLADVEANNKTLLAEKQQQETMAAYYQTGLAPGDPELALDWLKGFPASAGNQVDFIAAQAFDFPSSYKHRRELAARKTEQAEYAVMATRQAVLLEARMACVQLVYLNRKEAELSRRLRAAEQFLESYEQKLDKQDATILEVNKARLLVLRFKTDLRFLETLRNSQLQILTGLNGGQPVAFQDTIYPPADTPADFESLWTARQAADPELKMLRAKRNASEAEEQLTKSLLLPGMEAGYRYQGILGQRFHGVHMGLRFPIWENKKRMQYQSLQIALDEARIDEKWMEGRSSAQEEYDRYVSLSAGLKEYGTALGLVSNASNLERALEAGQITVLEYFNELAFYYDSADRYLELEVEMQKALAGLKAFEL